MAEFDAVRALREELAGLGEVERVLRAAEARALAAASVAEADLNAARKVLGFFKIFCADKRAELRRLEEDG